MCSRLIPGLLLAAACAAHAPQPAPATSSTAPALRGGAKPPAAAPTAEAGAVASASPPVPAAQVAGAAPAAPPSLIAEARELLDAMLRVDTSKGAETSLLEPVAARLRQAGVAVELVESEPGRGNLIARVRGNGSKRPLMLLAHVDVVPTAGQPWTSEPYTPTEKDGFLVARGVGDDKGMAAAATAIVLELARNKTPLARDVVLALTAGEETGGDAGVRFLAAHKRELIDAELVLNEGGSMQLAPDLKTLEAVLVSVGEKTFQSFRVTAKADGGHSSTPPPPGKDPVLHLSRALTRIGEYRFPVRLLPAAQGVFGLQAKYEKPPLSDAMARIAKSGKVSRKDEAILAEDKIYNAFLRTTCVTTMLAASPQENVLPTSAEAVVNCRVLPGETPETTRAALEKLLASSSTAPALRGGASSTAPALRGGASGPTLTLAFDGDKGFSAASPIEGDVMAAVRSVTASSFPGVPVVPSFTLGATDSRHLRAVGMLAYGISVTPTSLDESRAGHGAHGPDERRPLAFLAPGVQFLKALTLALAQ
jgi:acetylornithine deacetylase/succinyl-diaminopimelate desuccinylase-like protein